MMNRTLCRLTTVITAGAIQLLMPSPGLAQATAAVSLPPTAQLDIRILATVQVAYTCTSGPELDRRIDVTVSQAGGHETNNGSASSSDLICDGTPRTVDVAVQSFRPYHNGRAAARADFFVCEGEFFQCTRLASDGFEVITLK